DGALTIQSVGGAVLSAHATARPTHPPIAWQQYLAAFSTLAGRAGLLAERGGGRPAHPAQPIAAGLRPRRVDFFSAPLPVAAKPAAKRRQAPSHWNLVRAQS